MCHKTGYGSWVFLVRRLLLTGFVQSLEFLKKSWSFPSTFPELEKVCKIEVKSWKNGKKSWFFFKATTSSSQVKRVLCLWNLIQSRLHVMEKASFLQGFFFKLSIDHLFHNLESGKKIIVLEKVWRKSWILYQKSVRTLCLCSRERKPCILALYVPRVTNINFLLTTSAVHQE